VTAGVAYTLPAVEVAGVHRSQGVDRRDLRVAGGVMLAGAVALRLLPGDVGVPCPLRSLTGIPCPLCGMTTSVTAATHLQLGEALAANPAGIVAVVAAVVVLVSRRRAPVVLPGWAPVAGLAVMWMYQLVRFSIV
jgi:hypothetical protein